MIAAALLNARPISIALTEKQTALGALDGLLFAPQH
jgi:hypothetical protein